MPFYQGTTILRLTDLNFRFSGSHLKTIDDISFDWHPGELTVLTGASGSGKSTLGRLIKGLLAPDSGMISLIENGVARVFSSRERVDLIGWTDALPERQMFAADVLEEVGYALINRGVKGNELKRRVETACKKASLDPQKFLNRDPLTLSGGEKRRVIIASTIVVDYPYLIFDEPAGGLDEMGINAVSDLISQLAIDGAAVMVISHDPAGVWRNADRILALDNGKLAGDFSSNHFDWNKLNSWLETGFGEPQ